MSANELYAKLIAHLEDELKVYRHLLDIVRKEKDILIAAKVEDLNENNKAKELMMVKLRQQDRTREKIARELAVEIGANTETPRLLDLATKLDSERADRLRQLHQTFSLLIQRVKDLNKKNEVLAHSALENIQGAMRALKTTLGESPTYKKQGDLKKTEVMAGQFVSREA